MKMGKSWIARIGFSVLAVAIISALVASFVLPRVTVRANRSVVSISLEGAVPNTITYPVDWYADTKLQNGLWYSDINNPIFINGLEVSFMKIYSSPYGPDSRVMELSTYPRAYKDTSPHVYTVDTPFTVTEDDLNNYYNPELAESGWYQVRDIPADTHIYVDSHRLVFLLGETAVHYAGDPLPGAFPLWVESETLPTPSWVDNKNSVFPLLLTAVKGELVQTTLYEGVYKQNGDTSWTVIPTTLFNAFKDAFTSATGGEIKINKITRNKDRTVIRVIYEKVHIP